jgi:hypothetical protein
VHTAWSPIQQSTDAVSIYTYPTNQPYSHQLRSSASFSTSPHDSNAYTGGVTDEECLLSEIEACQDYNKKLVELSELIEEVEPKMDAVKGLASEIKAIKIANPEIKAGADSPTLRRALAVAQKATEENGATSPEAKLAWENVEELAAAGTENSMGENLLDECLVEEIEACEGLEELQRVLANQKA